MACTVIKMPVVNFFAIKIILSIGDLVNPFEVPVEMIAATMLSVKNKLAIVSVVIVPGVIAPFKIFKCHLLLYCKVRKKKMVVSFKNYFFRF